MILDLCVTRNQAMPQTTVACEHRAVSKDGRIVCRKIVEGDNAISPSLCLDCPVVAINCSHLRFSLRQTSPSPLIVRFNGRTEIWGDEPPELQLYRAACAEQVIPIDSPRRCLSCTLREPVHAPVALEKPHSGHEPTRRAAQPQAPPCVAPQGKVVPFPQFERQVAAACAPTH